MNIKLECTRHYKVSFLNNPNLKTMQSDFLKQLENNLPSIPTTLADEIECNIFLRAKDLESFSKLRDLKDIF